MLATSIWILSLALWFLSLFRLWKTNRTSFWTIRVQRNPIVLRSLARIQSFELLDSSLYSADAVASIVTIRPKSTHAIRFATEKTRPGWSSFHRTIKLPWNDFFLLFSEFYWYLKKNKSSTCVHRYQVASLSDRPRPKLQNSTWWNFSSHLMALHDNYLWQHEIRNCLLAQGRSWIAKSKIKSVEFFSVLAIFFQSYCFCW